MRLAASGLALTALLLLLAGCSDQPPTEVEPVEVKEIAIHGTQYDPQTATMQAGGTLRFENHETVAHTATATASPMGNLESGDIAPDGGSHAFEDMQTGTYAFTCRHHGNMRLTVTVNG